MGWSQRAARARFAKSATRSGSLRGRCPATRAASTPEATSTPTAGIAQDRLADVRRVEPAGQDHRQGTGDGGREADRRPGAGAAGMWAAGRVEQDPLDARGELGLAAGDRRAAASSSSIAGRLGGQADALPGRPVEAAGRASALSSPESWTTSGSSAAMISPSRSNVASAVIATTCGRPAAEPPARARRASSTASSSVEAARRARDDVQADRIGAGREGREDPGRVGDAADLDERRPVLGREVLGQPAGGGEPGGCRGRIRRAHQGLADERRIEAERPPAGDRGRVADARLGDDEAILRHERRAGAPPARGRPPASAGRGCSGRSGGRRVASARSSSRSSWASTSGSRPRSRAASTRRPRRAAGWRLARSSTRSAPAARSRGSWRGSTTNSLARTGTLTAARTARRSSTEPPNQCGSHRTEIDRRATRRVGPRAGDRVVRRRDDLAGRRRGALDLGDQGEAGTGEPQGAPGAVPGPSPRLARGWRC